MCSSKCCETTFFGTGRAEEAQECVPGRKFARLYFAAGCAGAGILNYLHAPLTLALAANTPEEFAFCWRRKAPMIEAFCRAPQNQFSVRLRPIYAPSNLFIRRPGFSAPPFDLKYSAVRAHEMLSCEKPNQT